MRKTMSLLNELRLCAMAVLALVGACASVPPAAPQRAQTHALNQDVFYHIFVRSFRDSNGDDQGDLEGIRQGLDYLDDLGVTSILLTPIYPSRFYHNYFADDFEGVDPEFGDMDAFARLVRDVHNRGMKIYLDQEFQYVTTEHEWFRQSIGNPSSPFSDHLIYHAPGNQEPESGVFGLVEIPTWDGQSIAHHTVNLRSERSQRYFTQYLINWMDPNGDGRFDDGVDGFRIDHMMDDLDNKGVLTNLFADVWRPMFARLRAVNPDVRLIAEQADWGYGDDFLTRGDADYVFAFPLRGAILTLNKDNIVTAIAETERRTPAGRGQLVFIENHDTLRYASEVESDRGRLRAGAALNILLRGAPILYYGQEMGMRGRGWAQFQNDAKDIGQREAFRWAADLEAPESPLWYRGDGVWWTERFNRSGDGVSVAEESADPASLLSYYRRLLDLRAEHAALSVGDQAVLPTDGPVLAFVRREGADRVLALVNTSSNTASVDVNAGTVSHAMDILGDVDARIDGEIISVSLDGYESAVLSLR